MRVTNSPGMLFLGAWLVLQGLLPLLNVNVALIGPVMDVLGLAAGVLILLQRHLGLSLLGLWLVLTGVLTIFDIVNPNRQLLDLLAVLAGIFILRDR